MAFEKGSSGNPAGRPVGSANKIANAVRSVIAEVLAGTDVESLRTQLATLQGKDFIDAYVKLAEFVIPKLQRTALATEQESGRINVTLKIAGRTPEEHEANRINNSRITSHLLGEGEGG